MDHGVGRDVHFEVFHTPFEHTLRFQFVLPKPLEVAKPKQQKIDNNQWE